MVPSRTSCSTQSCLGPLGPNCMTKGAGYAWTMLIQKTLKPCLCLMHDYMLTTQMGGKSGENRLKSALNGQCKHPPEISRQNQPQLSHCYSPLPFYHPTSWPCKNMSLQGQSLSLEEMLMPGIRGGWPKGWTVQHSSCCGWDKAAPHRDLLQRSEVWVSPACCLADEAGKILYNENLSICQ